MNFRQTYALLLLTLICLGAFLGCPDPYADMRFRRNGKTVGEIKIKSADGKGSLRVYGHGSYSQTGDRKFYLSITCDARYPHLVRDLSLNPPAIRATMKGELLPVDRHRVHFEDNETDKGKFYICMICPPCAGLFNLPDFLASPDADLLLLDFSNVVRMGDKPVFTDTVYAVIPERLKCWAARLRRSKR